jgi:hypothetical protein
VNLLYAPSGLLRRAPDEEDEAVLIHCKSSSLASVWTSEAGKLPLPNLEETCSVCNRSGFILQQQLLTRCRDLIDVVVAGAKD